MTNLKVDSTYNFSDDHSKLLHLYGIFMCAWSALESVLQAAIMKELDVSATKAVIITGKMQFNPRAQLLANLLKHSEHPNKEAITLINKMEGFAHRNTIVHGLMVVGEPDKLTFVKYDGGASLKQTFTPTDLLKHVRGLNDRIIKLQALLDVSESDLESIGSATLSFVKR